VALTLKQKLTKALGARIISSRALPGGDIADVSLLKLENHTEVVAKRPRADMPDTTAVEARMLKHLGQKSDLPVPKVLFQAQGLLVITYVPHKGTTDPDSAAESVAIHMAALHKVRAKGRKPYYGHNKDTFIGPLPQINTPNDNWADFFAENRLLAMSQSCANTHKIDVATMMRIEKLATKLSDLLPAQPESSLLHGDLWAGNMLIDGDRAAAFIDPAISYGHREMDLAFVDLMGGLTPRFFESYNSLYPITPGFHKDRKPLYQLWPLLVHVRLFGGGYVAQVETILTRFGC
jgi:fructosamine-3-kinase